MCDFVIFGATGDMAVRVLLPALYRCDRDGRLPEQSRVITTARAGLDDAGYRDKVRGELFRFVDPAARDGIAASDSLTGSVMFPRDASDDQNWPILADRCPPGSDGTTPGRAT